MMTRYLTTTGLSTLALLLVACGGSNNSNNSAPVVVAAPLLVDAGVDQTSDERTTVSLSGGATGGQGAKT
ncbi:MAG: hypothetical protein AAFP97_06580, partial [Pseudomonadota bacterium]